MAFTQLNFDVANWLCQMALWASNDAFHTLGSTISNDIGYLCFFLPTGIWSGEFILWVQPYIGYLWDLLPIGIRAGQLKTEKYIE